MAPALENVGRLVRLPTGCGEQNMVGLVPNIYLLQYLKSTKQPKKDLERKAKEYMEVGKVLIFKFFNIYFLTDWLQKTAEVSPC